MEPREHDTPAADAYLDVGNKLCGELALLLRSELASLAPGSVLRVEARDPAAREDLPAWCELTGHALLHSAPPSFWIRRKDN